MEAVVELVKDDYLVLSLPAQQQTIAFAATSDFNLGSRAHNSRQFIPGQKISAVIVEQASPENGAPASDLCACCNASGLRPLLNKLPRVPPDSTVETANMLL